jgi:hypothetical protein
MGLDSYWVKVCAPGATAPLVEFDPPLALCQGMLSVGGSETFRGKVYAEMIEAVSGVSLYQELMPVMQVHAIASALRHVIDSDEWPQYKSHPDLPDLSRMFTAYAEHNYSLAGWW